MSTDGGRLPGLTTTQRIMKRGIDICVSAGGLVLVGWVVAIGWIAATLATRENGFFRQPRVGMHGREFMIVKLRTMKSSRVVSTTVTTANDPRLTSVGRVLRRYKIDELPQLWNVLIGQMSLVGPRPDVPGFADRLVGEDRIVLDVRPGITGPASVKYRNEESILASQEDPEAYNAQVIWPDKVAINREYVEDYSIRRDFTYLWLTVRS